MQNQGKTSAKAGLKVKFHIGIWSLGKSLWLLLGLERLQAANVTIHSSGRVFIEEELVPAEIVGGDGTDYHVARVVLETDTMLPPESECLVWAEVDNPKPGVCAETLSDHKNCGFWKCCHNHGATGDCKALQSFQ